MVGKAFKCALCGGDFLSAWSEAEARAEFARDFPRVDFDATRLVEICEPCHQKVTAEPGQLH